MQFAF